MLERCELCDGKRHSVKQRVIFAAEDRTSSAINDTRTRLSSKLNGKSADVRLLKPNVAIDLGSNLAV